MKTRCLPRSEPHSSVVPPRSLIIIPTGSTKFNRNPLNNFGGESCEWTNGEAVSTFPVIYTHKWH